MYPKGYQQGFLMPVAIFILVILAGVAITVSRFGSQTGSAVTQEAISIASFYAAESGGQYVMNRLYYSTTVAPTRAIVEANCTAINGAGLNLTSQGLTGCQVSLTCGFTQNVPTATTFFTVTSRGQCGQGTITADRTIELSSFLRDI